TIVAEPARRHDDSFGRLGADIAARIENPLHGRGAYVCLPGQVEQRDFLHCLKSDPRGPLIKNDQNDPGLQWSSSATLIAKQQREASAGLERFRAKWAPVRVKKTRQNKSQEPVLFRFNRTGPG